MWGKINNNVSFGFGNIFSQGSGPLNDLDVDTKEQEWFLRIDYNPLCKAWLNYSYKTNYYIYTYIVLVLSVAFFHSFSKDDF